ncbi:MAG: YihY/virulence factor BrkB family protein [Dehalococcoidia bacterium]
MTSLFTILKRSVASFGTDRCATLSAAIAYRTVFALFPLALIGVSLFGVFMEDEAARQRVIDGVNDVVPLGPDGEQEVSNMLQGISSASGLLGIAGLLIAAWSASSLLGEIRGALNVIWDVDRPRPMLRAKATDLALLFGFGGLLVASTASTGVLTGARRAGAEWIGPLLDLADPLFVVLLIAVPFLLTWLAFLFLYKVAPHARLRWRDVVLAAAIAAIFFEFGKNLLAFYIAKMSNFNALAGSLSAAILFLVFVYYAAQVVLFGAELAKHRLLIRAGTLPATDRKPSTAPVPLPQKLKQAALDLWRIDESHHDAELPYQPSRLDPSTNGPTNTREEVIMRWEDDAPDRGPSGASRPTVVAGEARRLGERLFIESEGKVTPVTLASDARVTRNGEQVDVSEIRSGDWTVLTMSPEGSTYVMDATDTMQSASPDRQHDASWLKALALAGPLVAAAVKRLRGGASNGKRRIARSPLLRRRPSQ